MAQRFTSQTKNKPHELHATFEKAIASFQPVGLIKSKKEGPRGGEASLKEMLERAHRMLKTKVKKSKPLYLNDMDHEITIKLHHYSADDGFSFSRKPLEGEGYQEESILDPRKQKIQDLQEKAEDFKRSQERAKKRAKNIEKRKKGEPTDELEHSRKTFKKLHKNLMEKFAGVGEREELPQELPQETSAGGMRRRKSRRKSRKKRRKSRKSKKTKRRRRRRRRK